MTTIATLQLDHFLYLARRGKHPGCSGGERRAHRLAKAIVDNAPGLDANAIDGMIEFARAAVAHPQEARDVLA